ncbi:retinol dehydrogenase 13-like [Sipha flava]|uniref:Retinol dehydrogenase 13-like n=1 Tax=Sipha flava TaxID=143950 RepID=A0A8B8FHD8_9HEMI|nr:retinol dehydrogenase 13-like [Sipha flava]XP_025410310.1 retinol dehydrogenase 13-like [Sipha flava]
MINCIKLIPYATSVVVGLYLIKRYFAGGVCKCNTDLTGKTVIVTGGATGIGKEVALALAKKGAKVVITCRNQFERLSLEDKWLLNLEYLYLDLKSFNSIREFSQVIHDRFDSIYALVNNAAVFYQNFHWTEDDFESTFQTNYLGPFLLTHLLLDLIHASPDGGRIVNVTCEAHRYVRGLKPIYANLGYLSHSRFAAYAESKACLQLFSHKLSLSLTGTSVTVNDANPGNVRTALWKLYFNETYHPFLLKLYMPLHWLLSKSPVEGAQTPLHLVLSPDLRGVTGKYFSDCVERDPSPLCVNSKIAEGLWIQSLAWVNHRLQR